MRRWEGGSMSPGALPSRCPRNDERDFPHQHMRYRRFGRTGWQVGEVGYGMWGMGGWTGSDDRESLESLQLAVDLGGNFFDTAWAYGDGRSERLLGETVRANRDRRLYTATKVPPKNRVWPPRRDSSLDEVFPPDHIQEYAERSLANLGLPSIDLLQFHVWEDAWSDDDRWQRAVDDLKRQGVERANAVTAVLPTGMKLPELALRFILSNPDVSVTIPGMRRPQHVRQNLATSDAGALPAALRAALRAHR